MWHAMDIGRVVIEGLAREERSLRIEQAVAGIDSLPEVRLHALIARAFESTGFGVAREVPYPSLSPEQKRDPQRQRCDVVLTPGSDAAVRDAIRTRREATAAEGMLFSPPKQHGAAPGECLWIEVKCVGQFTYTRGVPGPNRSYSSELVGAVRGDAAKLAADSLIECGAALVVLFAESRHIAEHDFGIAAHRALDRGVSIKSVRLQHAEIVDRIGNRVMTAGVFEVGR